MNVSFNLLDPAEVEAVKRLIASMNQTTTAAPVAPAMPTPMAPAPVAPAAPVVPMAVAPVAPVMPVMPAATPATSPATSPAGNDPFSDLGLQGYVTELVQAGSVSVPQILSILSQLGADRISALAADKRPLFKESLRQLIGSPSPNPLG